MERVRPWETFELQAMCATDIEDMAKVCAVERGLDHLHWCVVQREARNRRSFEVIFMWSLNLR